MKRLTLIFLVIFISTSLVNVVSAQKYEVTASLYSYDYNEGWDWGYSYLSYAASPEQEFVIDTDYMDMPQAEKDSLQSDGSFAARLDAEQFIATIQSRQGLLIGCIEEIAYKKRWISKSELLAIASKYKNSPYGVYLFTLAQ